MSDLQLLFAVLLGLYLWECVCWLPRGTVAVSTWLGRNWKIARPGSLIGNARGGAVLAAPLPPLGAVFAAKGCYLAVSAGGAAVRSAGRSNWELLPLKELGAVHADRKKVCSGNKVLFRTASAHSAAQTMDLLKKWKALTGRGIEDAFVEHVRAALDVRAIELRRSATERDFKTLQWLANSLVLYLFALSPLIIRHFGLLHSWPYLLFGLLALTLTTSWVFSRAHARAYPGLGDERFTHCLTMCLSPANAARAHDLYGRCLFEQFHPLALAACFCGRDELRRFATETLRDLRHPIPATEPKRTPLDEVVRGANEILRREVERFLAARDMNPDSLLGEPPRTDESSLAYCPRCLAQFVSSEGRCADCGGLELVRFGSVLPPPRATSGQSVCERSA